uniref:Uncharacterized protein n=1 Tax=Biomphalaria glabrata TaxID=6526 RepID=A0A2C9KCE6_BIOGL
MAIRDMDFTTKRDRDLKIKHDRGDVSLKHHRDVSDRDVSLKHHRDLSDRDVSLKHHRDLSDRDMSLKHHRDVSDRDVSLKHHRDVSDRDVSLKHHRDVSDRDVSLKHHRDLSDRDMSLKHHRDLSDRDVSLIHHIDVSDRDMSLKHQRDVSNRDVLFKHDRDVSVRDVSERDLSLKHQRDVSERDLSLKHQRDVSERDLSLKHQRDVSDRDLSLKHHRDVSDRDMSLKHQKDVSDRVVSVKHDRDVPVKHDRDVSVRDVSSKHDRDMLVKHDRNAFIKRPKDRDVLIKYTDDVIVKHDRNMSVEHDRNMSIKHKKEKLMKSKSFASVKRDTDSSDNNGSCVSLNRGSSHLSIKYNKDVSVLYDNHVGSKSDVTLKHKNDISISHLTHYITKYERDVFGRQNIASLPTSDTNKLIQLKGFPSLSSNKDICVTNESNVTVHQGRDVLIHKDRDVEKDTTDKVSAVNIAIHSDMLCPSFIDMGTKPNIVMNVGRDTKDAYLLKSPGFDLESRPNSFSSIGRDLKDAHLLKSPGLDLETWTNSFSSIGQDIKDAHLLKSPALDLEYRPNSLSNHSRETHEVHFSEMFLTQSTIDKIYAENDRSPMEDMEAVEKQRSNPSTSSSSIVLSWIGSDISQTDNVLAGAESNAQDVDCSASEKVLKKMGSSTSTGLTVHVAKDYCQIRYNQSNIAQIKIDPILNYNKTRSNAYMQSTCWDDQETNQAAKNKVETPIAFSLQQDGMKTMIVKSVDESKEATNHDSSVDHAALFHSNQKSCLLGFPFTCVQKQDSFCALLSNCRSSGKRTYNRFGYPHSKVLSYQRNKSENMTQIKTKIKSEQTQASDTVLNSSHGSKIVDSEKECAKQAPPRKDNSTKPEKERDYKTREQIKHKFDPNKRLRKVLPLNPSTSQKLAENTVHLPQQKHSPTSENTVHLPQQKHSPTSENTVHLPQQKHSPTSENTVHLPQQKHSPTSENSPSARSCNSSKTRLSSLGLRTHSTTLNYKKPDCEPGSDRTRSTPQYVPQLWPVTDNLSWPLTSQCIANEVPNNKDSLSEPVNCTNNKTIQSETNTATENNSTLQMHPQRKPREETFVLDNVASTTTTVKTIVEMFEKRKKS